MVTGTKQGRLYWWPQPVAAASNHNGRLYFKLEMELLIRPLQADETQRKRPKSG